MHNEAKACGTGRGVQVVMLCSPMPYLCAKYWQLPEMTMPYSVLPGFKRQIQEMDPLMGDW